MNFYKRYPGDYRKKTARLTLAQHGVYSLLLDEYYLLEEALPADLDELYRICVAISKADQEAVRLVADRFFPIADDGLRHNERADEELAEAAPAIEAARNNGKKGGRPKKPRQEPSGNPVGFQNGNPDGTQRVTQTVTQTEPSPKPRGRVPQSPEYREREKEGAQSVRESPARAPEAPPEQPTPAGRIGLALRRGGLQPGQFQTSDPRIAAMAEAGYTDDEVEAVAREAVEKRKGFPWVVAALQGRRADAAAIAAGPAAPPPPDWRTDRNEVIRRGCELGLGPYQNLDHSTGQAITFDAYRRSVIAADDRATAGSTA